MHHVISKSLRMLKLVLNVEIGVECRKFIIVPISMGHTVLILSLSSYAPLYEWSFFWTWFLSADCLAVWQNYVMTTVWQLLCYDCCFSDTVSRPLCHDQCVMTTVSWPLCHDLCVTTKGPLCYNHCMTMWPSLCDDHCVTTTVWPLLCDDQCHNQCVTTTASRPLCHNPCVTTTVSRPPYEPSSLFSIFTRPFNICFPTSNYPKKVTNSYSMDLSTNMRVRNICIQYFFMEKPLSIYSMYNCIAVRIGG